MIKILELLENAYPKPCVAEVLMKKTGLSDIDGEFSQIIKYLKDTNKIIVVFIPENRMGYPTGRDKLYKWLQKIDEITINPAGIDFLTKLKSLEINDERNKAIAKATVVLALVGFMQAVLYFMQFSKEVNNILSWLALTVMGVMVIIIFNVAWQSFAHLLNQRFKSV